MEASEILKKAWDAVVGSGVPESMQDTAFREAVAILRGDDGGGLGAPRSGRNGQAAANAQAAKQPPVTRRPTQKSQKRRAEPAGSRSVEVPDEETFFAALANESGASETDLRDILQLSADGTISVTPPTRRLGGNKAEQARTVVALVACARRFGLNENPVQADAVRRECQRKNCFDSSNFATTVIGRLPGINYGGTNAEFVLTSKWITDFTAAVDRAHDRPAPAGKSAEK